MTVFVTKLWTNSEHHVGMSKYPIGLLNGGHSPTQRGLRFAIVRSVKLSFTGEPDVPTSLEESNVVKK